jgi:hypothetical protein
MLQLSSSDRTLVASILHFDLIDDVVAINQEAANHRASGAPSIPSPCQSAPRSRRRSEVMLRLHSFFYSVVRRLLYSHVMRET